MDEITQQINNIEEFINSLRSVTTIPKDIDDAFRTRLGITAGASSVSVASKTQVVNESGSGSYSVAKPMTAIVKVNIGGKIYNLADYS